MSRFRLWFVAALFLILSFGLPLATINALSERHPEIRIVQHGETLSTMIVVDNARLLIVHSDDRRETRSALGYLVRPWETFPTMVVAASEDKYAVGLWESIRHPDVDQVLVAGIPGSDPLWTTIERDSGGRDRSLTYLTNPVRVHLGQLAVDIHPAVDGVAAHVRIAHDQVAVAISLGSTMLEAAAHVTIASAGGPLSEEGLTVLPAAAVEDRPDNAVLVRRNETVTLILESDRIRVGGGRYFDPASAD